MTINNITFLHQLVPNTMFVFNNSWKTRFYFNDSLEFTQFLASLETDQVYVLTFDFVISWMMYDEDNPVISLSKPILITKNSNPRVLADYLNHKINEACNLHYLDESFLNSDSLNMNNPLDLPGVILNYSKINLF
jgi:hypothetical protein